jgi:threonyl-tRNA synthetase
MKTLRNIVNKPKEQTLEIEKMRHTASHVLAAAVLQLFPNAKLGIGPAIENGFYYDFELDKPLQADDLVRIGSVMAQIIKANLPMKRIVVSKKKALEIEQDQGYKKELISEIPEDEEISFYILGKLDQLDQLDKYEASGLVPPLTPPYKGGESAASNQQPAISFPDKGGESATSFKLQATSFADLCAGPHLPSTGQVGAFKLTHTAGAYWKGSEKNKMLTRIYGLAFDTQAELDEHLLQIEEAKKRDHRILGPQLDLYSFSELVGSGLPLWAPKGVIMRNLLDDFIWSLRREYGFEKVEIPHITKKDLYEKSGHWDKFKDELFKINTREGHLFCMKPMNCPHHTQIFARRKWSYKDMPQRYANTTMVYRDEQSGELNGLSRVLCITQDDAHVFCRPEQVKQETLNLWNIVETFYSKFGFELKMRLSLHDPNMADKYLGNPKSWEFAEGLLRQMATEKGADFYEGVGEAAFYGPKLDFMGKDSLGREWQLATIQVDVNMPGRFDLAYTNADGKDETPIMLHAAVMGATERFLSILIEHYAGHFPLWLAPEQIVVLPISEKQNEYATNIYDKLIERGFRARLDNRNETLGKRIRENELLKIPYIIVIGDKEIENNTVSVRQSQKGDLGTMSVDKFLELLFEQRS